MSAPKQGIVIMAGGTGGHIFPGLALAQAFTERGFKITWLGTRAGLEAQLVPEAGYALAYISIVGVRGTRWLNRLLAPLRLLWAGLQALRCFIKLKPAMVIGLGGYASGPGGLAAWLLRIPLVVHEQNSIPGTTNHFLSKLSCLNLEGFQKTFPQAIWTGNPIRDSLCQMPPPAERFRDRTGPIRILILGGSRGALALNQGLPHALSLIEDAAHKLAVWHQTGGKDHADVEQSYQRAGIRAQVQPFIDDMAVAYAWADLVICRAGALSVSELMVVGLAAILIPFPFAIDDHQTHNAQVLTQQGSAQIIQQVDASPQNLSDRISAWLERDHLLKLALSAHQLARPDATQRVVDECLGVLHGLK